MLVRGEPPDGELLRQATQAADQREHRSPQQLAVLVLATRALRIELIERLAHTDRDARWTIKHGKSYYGYKLHGNVDARYKLIRQMKITAANADDGQQLPDVLQGANTRNRLLADRGYDSAANRQVLQRHGLADGIARRAKPGQTAKVRLKQRNKTINRTRARVEHVFAALSQQGGKRVRAMTLARNALAITLQCVAYNARRLVWLVKSAGASAQPA